MDGAAPCLRFQPGKPAIAWNDSDAREQLVDALVGDAHRLLGHLPAQELDQAGLKRLTGLDTAVAGALEQNLFHVNQMMQFGKFLAVLQADPANPGRTVVTAFVALALGNCARLFFTGFRT